MVAAATVGAAAISAGAGIYSSSKQASGAKAGGDASYASTLASIDFQKYALKESAEQTYPWRSVGASALGELGALYGIGQAETKNGMLVPGTGLLSDAERQAAYDRFQTSPGYEFAFDEGIKALDRSAAARGGLRSGGYGRELTRYGQGMANQEFNNYANRLSSIAGAGQTATGQQVSALTTAGANIGQTYMQGGAMQANALQNAATARASGYASVGNAVNSGVNNYMLYSLLNK